MEATGGRRLLIRQADRVVLLGRQRAQHRGVYYCRTGLYESPLPPIPVRHARRARETSDDDDAWAARWTHQFAAWLQARPEGPLHVGRWTLAWGMPRWAVPGHWRRVHVIDPDQGHITWFGYGDPDEDVRDVLPLRRLSPHTAARVKSYRRQHREGILPPALLWWVSGLNVLLVVDGHDRIAAALAEGGAPEVVVLAPTADPRWISAVQQPPLRAYEGRIVDLQSRPAGPLDGSRIAHLGNHLATELRGIARTEGPTRAWPVPGGYKAWDNLAAELAPAASLGSTGVGRARGERNGRG